MGEGATATAGLAGTDGAVVGGRTRAFFVCGSPLVGVAAATGSFSTSLAAGISSLLGGCRLALALVFTVAVEAFALSLVGTCLLLFSADVSTLSTFLVAVLLFADTSGVGFLSLDSVFFNTGSATLLDSSLGAGALAAEAFAGALVGVAGIAPALITGVAAVTSAAFTACLPFFVFAGVSGLAAVTGTTGTAGTIVEDVVRDIGREPGREPGRETVSAITFLGMAGAVKPGGMEGVARRGCSKNCPLRGVASGGRTVS
jgi:hypothetical protein